MNDSDDPLGRVALPKRIRIPKPPYAGTYTRSQERAAIYPTWISDAAPNSMPLAYFTVKRWLEEGKAEEVKE
jgi:hypothetical protein